ncbi:hypothetical protein ES707_10978 [subsurface metagenome]
MVDTNKEWVNEPVGLGILPGIRTSDVGDIAYWQNIYELRKAPRVCMQKEYWLSAIKLIYSGIDNLAWLTREHDRLNVERKDFMDFADKYLLPDSGLSCSSEELYSARCGLLHCNTAESTISRSGEARYLSYATGLSPEEIGYEHIRPESRDRYVVVHIDRLYKVYDKSIDRLNQRISQEAHFADFIYRRSVKLYGLPIEE